MVRMLLALLPWLVTIGAMDAPLPDGIYVAWHGRCGWTARLICRGRVEATVKPWQLGPLIAAQDPRAVLRPAARDRELDGEHLVQAQETFTESTAVRITWRPIR